VTAKRMGRPPGSGLPPEERKTLVQARFGPEDHANLRLVRHLLGASNDSDAIRRALQWTVLDAGEHLTAEQRAEILAG